MSSVISINNVSPSREIETETAVTLFIRYMNEHQQSSMSYAMCQGYNTFAVDHELNCK